MGDYFAVRGEADFSRLVICPPLEESALQLVVFASIETLDGARYRRDRSPIASGRFHVSNGACDERLRKIPEAQFRARFVKIPFCAANSLRQKESGSVVKPLAQKLGQKYFVTLGIRGVFEFGEDFEMRLAGAYRRSGARCLFEKHEKSQPGSRRGFERPFPVRGPDICRIPKRFFGAIIEIISERGSDL